MDQCRLCLQHVPKLQDSHFLPAGIYRRLRDDNEKNPNPYLITAKTAVQTSDQMKARLLCRDCEQRFSKGGESWVLSNCLQKDGGFPLLSALNSISPDVSAADTPTRLYFADKIPEIDVLAVAYFAMSIFWRGAIHPWKTDGTVPVPLGPFQEQFRQYLMGARTFPKECAALWAVIREGKETDRLTYEPTGNRIGKFHSYRFPMPGFCFILFAGKNIPASFTEKCFAAGIGNPIIVTSILEAMLLEEAVKMRSKSLRVKNWLA
jgi:hypothetical protein